MISDDNKECSICLDYMNISADVFVLTCKHEFHKKCLQRWCLENNICPICRATISIPKTRFAILRETLLKCYFVVLHTFFLGSMILNILYSNVYEEYTIVIFWVFATVLLYKQKEALSYLAYIAFACVIVDVSHRLMTNKSMIEREIRLLCSVSLQSCCMLLIDSFPRHYTPAFS